MRRGQTVYKGGQTLYKGGGTDNLLCLLYGFAGLLSGPAQDEHGQYKIYFDENVRYIYIQDHDVQIYFMT